MILLNSTWEETKKWVAERLNKNVDVRILLLFIIYLFIYFLFIYFLLPSELYLSKFIMFYKFHTHTKSKKVGSISGVLKYFIVEPFVPHKATDEYYICIYSIREGDEILFYHEGGVDIGDVDSKAEKIVIETGKTFDVEAVQKDLLKHAPQERKALLASYIQALYNVYVQLHFTYLEINPVVIVNDTVTFFSFFFFLFFFFLLLP